MSGDHWLKVVTDENKGCIYVECVCGWKSQRVNTGKFNPNDVVKQYLVHINEGKNV